MVQQEVKQLIESTGATGVAGQNVEIDLDMKDDEEQAKMMKDMQVQHQKNMEKAAAEATEAAKKQKDNFTQAAADAALASEGALKLQMGEFKKMMATAEENMAKHVAGKRARTSKGDEGD